ncbi:hypothetical protein AB0P40_41880 [Streptomyces sp. NPDC079189]|uniref:hypothetical protein n=1 Tax=Streptomyces sp. NPDC079189 TaxID=3154514 RepID=UPI003425CA39
MPVSMMFPPNVSRSPLTDNWLRSLSAAAFVDEFRQQSLINGWLMFTTGDGGGLAGQLVS